MPARTLLPSIRKSSGTPVVDFLTGAGIGFQEASQITTKRKLPKTGVYTVVSTTLLLRIASVISLLFTAGHTLGGLKKWSPMGENEVLKAMTTVRFETMGANRSYFDFFMGFGWSISVAMLLQTVLLWQMASMARTNKVHVRPMIAVFALATLASGTIAWRFIFLIPAVFSGVLLVTLVAAYASANSVEDTDRE